MPLIRGTPSLYIARAMGNHTGVAGTMSGGISQLDWGCDTRRSIISAQLVLNQSRLGLCTTTCGKGELVVENT